MEKIQIDIQGRHFLFTQGQVVALDNLLQGTTRVQKQWNSKTEVYDISPCPCPGHLVTATTLEWKS